MLDHRPFYPNERELEMVTRLSGGFQYMTARFVVIQRGLQEMEAWLTMMNSWRFRSSMKPLSIPKVKNDRVSVWLNGASKLDGYWLLCIGVIPVYVIHTYREDIDFPVSNKSIQDRQQQDFAVDFVRHTHADRLNHGAWNSYLMSPSQVDHKEPSTVVHDGFQQVAQFVCDEPSSSRSASWSFRVAQRENKLSAADIQVPSEDTTCTG
jgi:hypothetical protein